MENIYDNGEMTLETMKKNNGLSEEEIFCEIAGIYGIHYKEAKNWVEISKGDLNVVSKILHKLSEHKRTTVPKDREVMPVDWEKYKAVCADNERKRKELVSPQKHTEEDEVINDAVNYPAYDVCETCIDKESENLSDTEKIAKMLNKLNSGEWGIFLNPKYTNEIKGKKSELNTIKYVESPCCSPYYTRIIKDIFNKLKVGDNIFYFNGAGWVEESLDIYTIKRGTIIFIDPTDSIEKTIDILDPTKVIYTLKETINEGDTWEGECWGEILNKAKNNKVVNQIKKGNFTVERKDYTKPIYIKTKEGELIGPFREGVVEEYRRNMYFDILTVLQKYTDFKNVVDGIYEFSKINQIFDVRSISFNEIEPFLKKYLINPSEMKDDIISNNKFVEKYNNISPSTNNECLCKSEGKCCNNDVDKTECACQTNKDLVTEEVDNFFDKIDTNKSKIIMDKICDDKWTETDLSKKEIEERLQNLIFEVSAIACLVDDKFGTPISGKLECKINEPLKEKFSTETFGLTEDKSCDKLKKTVISSYEEIIDRLETLTKIYCETNDILKQIATHTKKI